jgi:hypothetical protein
MFIGPSARRRLSLVRAHRKWRKLSIVASILPVVDTSRADAGAALLEHDAKSMIKGPHGGASTSS